MRITLPALIVNPDLEPADPLAYFIRPSLLAGYNMLDQTDFSGNNRNMAYNGAFSAQGAILTQARANAMTMPVPEQDSMTVFICLNAAANSTAQRNMLSNLTVQSTPYRGFRIAQQPSAGQVIAQWATEAPQNLAGYETTMLGAWTVRAFRWSPTMGASITHGGMVTTLPAEMVHTKNPLAPFYFSGIPEGVTAAGSITEGLVGTAGMVLFYGEALETIDCINIMDQIAANMALRGVTVP